MELERGRERRRVRERGREREEERGGVNGWGMLSGQLGIDERCQEG